MNIPEHLNFADLPTPIRPLKAFFKDLDGYEVWLKRDDLTGVELSGNKVRKLDFLMKDALRQGFGRVITCGGLQSNHCRATAFYAVQLGLKITLVLRGQPSELITGNLFLDKLLGADIRYITPEQYKDVDALMERLAADLPEPTYVIPEGGSNEVGAWGYLNAFYEIGQQGRFDAIVVPSGSGGTHSGLLLGKLLSKSPTEIFSVNVCDDAAHFKNKIDQILEKFCRRYHFHLNWSQKDIHIVDGFVGQGYALITQKEAEVIRKMARSEGLLIDPVYGAKALLGLEDQLRKKKIPGKKILYIQTGGVFGLFPLWEKILNAAV